MTLSACAYFISREQIAAQSIQLSSEATQVRAPAVAMDPLTSSDPYFSKVQTIFNARCVACHACYNSPCQLDLTSYEGVTRGAHKLDVYNFPKLKERPPTRLGIDGKSVADWRKKDFFSVIPDQGSRRENFETDSTFWALINMRSRGFEKKSEKWNAEESRTCPNSKSGVDSEGNLRTDELSQYKYSFPYGGMPYGLPSLADTDLQTLHSWLAAGAPGPSPQVQAALQSPGPLAADISQFEQFFNAPDFKSRLSARYIYEHLFLAHIYFSEKPGSFFRLVRARNQSGEPDEIATTRPYDDPGKSFFYRLKKYTATIVHKNHVPYAFNAQKLATWKKRFLQSQWIHNEEVWPPYGRAGVNPFVTFKAIPADARSRFFLDDAQYHTMTFIKGPVCNGQVAVGVIDDNFWVMYVNPEKDVTVIDPEFFEQNASLMSLPAAFPDNDVQIDEIRKNNVRVNQNKYALYKKHYPEGLDLSAVWDGDQNNPNALLTVYRHEDSAAVLKGAHGQTPKTIWLLDYAIFEDIYYNLVAGYNVFGPILHQVTTRQHMDHSRVDAQDLFLSLLPQEKRMEMRGQWTQQGPKPAEKINSVIAKLLREKSLEKRMSVEKPYQGMVLPTKIAFQTDDQKSELLEQIFSVRMNANVRGIKDSINGQHVSAAELSNSVDTFAQVEEWFSSIAGLPQKIEADEFDAAYVRVTLPDGNMKAYTLIHNKEHFNVSFLFMEEARRDFDHDSFNFVPGYAASYPNMYFDVKADQVPQFVSDLRALSGDKANWQKLLKHLGVLRSSDRFWAFHDWLNQNIKVVEPIEGGQLDLNRYSGEQ